MISVALGADPTQLVDALRDLAREADNVRGTSLSQIDAYNAYIEWSLRAERRLYGHVGVRELDSLIRSERYWQLHSCSPSVLGNNLGLAVELELEQRSAGLRFEAEELRRTAAGWGISEVVHAAVLDTNVLVTYGSRMNLVRWEDVVSARPFSTVTLVISAKVVDELDGLKDRGQANVRELARSAIRWLEQSFPTASRAHAISRNDPVVFARLLLDDPAHSPLPVADAEIVDRALTLQPFVASVTLVSADLGMRLRARNAGLAASAIESAHVGSSESA